MWECIFLLLLSYAIATSNVCGSQLDPSDFSSVGTMEANGWYFSWDDEKIDWPSTWCDAFGPPSYYCGYCTGLACIGELSLTLQLSGYSYGSVEINYGNVWDGSGVESRLYLNDMLLDSTSAESRTFGVAFDDGDVLKVDEYGVLILNGIEFNCSLAPTISPSVQPTVSPTVVPTTTISPSGLPTVSPTFPPTTVIPSISPTIKPTPSPTALPTIAVTTAPTAASASLTDGLGGMSKTELTVHVGLAVAIVMVAVLTCICLHQLRRDIRTIKMSVKILSEQMPAARDEIAMSVLPSSRVGEEGYIDSTI